MDGNGLGGYISVWKPKSGKAWQGWHNMNSYYYQLKFNQLVSQNYILTYFTGYQTNSGMRFACKWVKNTNGVHWKHYYNMNWETFASNMLMTCKLPTLTP